MSRLAILASVVALAAGTVGCGNSAGQANSLVDVGPSAIVGADSSQGDGTLSALAAGGKGGGGGKNGGGGTTTTGGGSLTLVLWYDLKGDGLPANWGDTVTFDISTTVTTTPYVDLKCYQNGKLVMSGSSGFYEGYPWPWTKYMNLSSSMWSSGAANCTAELYYGVNHTVLARINFDVGA
jgi:hypothetical protein